VKAEKIDFAAAFDGDGDRNMILSSESFVNPSDSVAGLFLFSLFLFFHVLSCLVFLLSHTHFKKQKREKLFLFDLSSSFSYCLKRHVHSVLQENRS